MLKILKKIKKTIRENEKLKNMYVLRKGITCGMIIKPKMLILFLTF
jgi:hypothetical protein